MLGVVLLVIVLLGVAQLLLPGIAAHRIRSQLGRYGQVQSVSVAAFPAIELLWHHADSVSVRMSSFQSNGSGLATRLDQLSDVGTLHAEVARVTVGRLTVRDARLVKHGSSLVATARVTDADLRGVLPVLRTVTPVTSAAGQLILRGTADLLGASSRSTSRCACLPPGRSSSHPTSRSGASRRSPPSATRRCA